MNVQLCTSSPHEGNEKSIMLSVNIHCIQMMFCVGGKKNSWRHKSKGQVQSHKSLHPRRVLSVHWLRPPSR